MQIAPAAPLRPLDSVLLKVVLRWFPRGDASDPDDANDGVGADKLGIDRIERIGCRGHPEEDVRGVAWLGVLTDISGIDSEKLSMV